MCGVCRLGVYYVKCAWICILSTLDQPVAIATPL